MGVENYLSEFNKMKNAFESENFSIAFHYAKRLVEKYPASYRPYVYLSLSLQLMEESPPGIEDPIQLSLHYLELAEKLEPKAAEPLYELGYYYHIVENDLITAREYFQEASEKIAYHLKPTLTGLLKCQVKLNDEEGYFDAIKLADEFFPDDFEFKMIKDEWGKRHLA